MNELRIIGEFPKECVLCSTPLNGRQDELCFDCRTYRIVSKRSMRPKIEPNKEPAVFSAFAK